MTALGRKREQENKLQIHTESIKDSPRNLSAQQLETRGEWPARKVLAQGKATKVKQPQKGKYEPRMKHTR